MGKVVLLYELYFNRIPLVGTVKILKIARLGRARLITGYCNTLNKMMMSNGREGGEM